MSVIPRALENPSLDDGFWQIRTFAATWLNGIFWSRTAGQFASVPGSAISLGLGSNCGLGDTGKASIGEGWSVPCFDQGGQLPMKRGEFGCGLTLRERSSPARCKDKQIDRARQLRVGVERSAFAGPPYLCEFLRSYHARRGRSVDRPCRGGRLRRCRSPALDRSASDCRHAVAQHARLGRVSRRRRILLGQDCCQLGRALGRHRSLPVREGTFFRSKAQRESRAGSFS